MRQLTRARHNHVLTNTGVWSPDSCWIVYDRRSHRSGADFDGDRIEMVQVQTGEVRLLYQSQNGAHCGVATFHPTEQKVIFILGPEHPTMEWQYNAWHRQGVIVSADRPGEARHLDACDITPPFTPGALRGGSHVHVWDAAGEWVSYTYEDHVLAQSRDTSEEGDINQRNVGVSIPGRPVRVGRGHPRNHDGEYFSVLVTQTVAQPVPGSDQISRAVEEAWVGNDGYQRTDGSRQRHALAFQGTVVTASGGSIQEVFIVDLPPDLTQAGDGPLCGTSTRAPSPPRDIAQRRLTFTANRKFPGVQGMRHWLRSSPDGSRIAFLMKDDAGVEQIWTVSPNGGEPQQLTHNPWPIASAYTWSPDGRYIAHVMDNSVCVTASASGKTTRLSSRTDDHNAPRPEACVFSPDGSQIAFLRKDPDAGVEFDQVFVVELGESLLHAPPGSASKSE